MVHHPCLELQGYGLFSCLGSRPLYIFIDADKAIQFNYLDFGRIAEITDCLATR